MNKIFKTVFNFYGLLIMVAVAGFITAAQAAQFTAVNFPIAELGNCQNQEACAVYCDKAENMDACIAYGASKGMISEAEAAVAKKAVARIKAGTTPGGCKDRESCANYCQSNISDLNNCISFAEEIGVPAAEIEQAKKIAGALAKGAGLPGNCQGKNACEAYCKDSNHIDECLVFAEAADILPADELAEAKKVAKFIKNGETPGGCKSKDECKAFCDQDQNFEACISFAQKAELVSAEEYEIAKKTGGKGPGDCKSKIECESYCNEPQNADACAKFAVEKNILSEEETNNIINGVAKIRAGLEGAPPEIRGDAESCLNNLLGGNLAGVLAGTQKLTQVQGDKVGACFEDAAKKYADQQAAAGAAAADGAGGQGSMPSAPNAGTPSINSAPPEIQEKINAEIQQRQQAEIQKNMPTNIPTPPPVTGAPSGGPVAAPAIGSQPPAGAPAGPDCSAFAAVPSCSMVGGGQAETICKTCFPNK